MKVESITPRDIYVIGAKDLAGEVWQLITRINQATGQTRYTFRGFVDKQPESKTKKIGQVTYQVFDEAQFLENRQQRQGALMAIGIQEPTIKQKVAAKFTPFFEFPNLIHPNFEGDLNSIEMGMGNIIHSRVDMTVNIQINSFCYFNLQVTVGHDAVIGSYCQFNPHATISGGVTIDDLVLIGTGADIKQGIRVGRNSILGAGAVLVKDLPENVVAVGNPAKVIKENAPL